ncbi:hypothetical protein RUM44_006579 [Polyplax serrata]|uniref:Fibronectin type-III domain-containing protein n=2 Tax=Polyplax serrata TaxID=468196 RepID=A0ABR1AIJ9_POLSC
MTVGEVDLKIRRNVCRFWNHDWVGEDGHWDVKNGIITSNNETSYQVVGLYPFTVYSFRVVATNSMGPSQPSKESYYMVTLREVKEEEEVNNSSLQGHYFKLHVWETS